MKTFAKLAAIALLCLPIHACSNNDDPMDDAIKQSQQKSYQDAASEAGRQQALNATSGMAEMIAECTDPDFASLVQVTTQSLNSLHQEAEAAGYGNMPGNNYDARLDAVAKDARDIGVSCGVLPPAVPSNPGWYSTWWLISS